MRLTEERAKAALRDSSCPVPFGARLGQADVPITVPEGLEPPFVVKALVPTGRRGKAGGIRVADDLAAARVAIADLLGSEIEGHRVDAVYLEQFVEATSEHYLSLSFAGIDHVLVVSNEGGVDVEESLAATSQTILIDPHLGVTEAAAAAIWAKAGADHHLVEALGRLTVQLHAAFVAMDAIILEINPISVTRDGGLVIVGALAEVDDSALFRHPGLATSAATGETTAERRVADLDRRLPGGTVRYIELEGTVGLFVGGGGAGLLQHDMLLQRGVRPANHSDYSPSPTPDKAQAVLEEVFSRPQVEAVLIAFNHLQMASCAILARAVLQAIEATGFDAVVHPIVVRLTGPEEEEARRILSAVPGLRYLAQGAGLEEAVDAIAELAKSAP